MRACCASSPPARRVGWKTKDVKAGRQAGRQAGRRLYVRTVRTYMPQKSNNPGRLGQIVVASCVPLLARVVDVHERANTQKRRHLRINNGGCRRRTSQQRADQTRTSNTTRLGCRPSKLLSAHVSTNAAPSSTHRFQCTRRGQSYAVTTSNQSINK